jgi:hypothetical protein
MVPHPGRPANCGLEHRHLMDRLGSVPRVLSVNKRSLARFESPGENPEAARPPGSDIRDNACRKGQRPDGVRLRKKANRSPPTQLLRSRLSLRFVGIRLAAISRPGRAGDFCHRYPSLGIIHTGCPLPRATRPITAQPPKLARPARPGSVIVRYRSPLNGDADPIRSFV